MKSRKSSGRVAGPNKSMRGGHAGERAHPSSIISVAPAGQGAGRFLMAVYQRLLDAYGPQGWWPGETPFEVMVGAILTQSAAWSNVEKAIHNLKEANVLDIQSLRLLPQGDLARLIYPSGYYNAKALKLKSLVEWLAVEFGGDLDRVFSLDRAELRSGLLGVHGVGEETADSIVLYAACKPIFVIDAYTRRILGRLGLAPEVDSYASYQALFMDNIAHDIDMFNEYHALLVRHGKDVCKSRPNCLPCCLRDYCQYDGRHA